MTDEEYKKYLSSLEWKSIRDKRIQMDGYKCTYCGSRENIIVHHTTYENVGHEKLDDLITLCKKCHYALHVLKKYEINDALEDWYVEIDTDKYIQTGEICSISKPVKVSEIMVDGIGSIDELNTRFAIHRPDWFYRLIEKIGGAKGKVVTSIMRRKNIENKIEGRVKDIVEWSGCSLKTVMDTLNIMRENDMLKTRTGMMMLNPGVEHRGDRQREAALMRLYSTFATTSKSKCEGDMKNG